MTKNYSYIVNMLRIFENSLDNEHEVGIKIPDLSKPYPLAVTRGGNDNFILFELVANNGDTFAVIQNYSQLNFSIWALPKQIHGSCPRRIGFLSDNDQ